MITINETYKIVNEYFWETNSNFTLPIDFPEEAIPLIMKGRALAWINAYDWLINLEWNSKHKINLPKPVANALKPQGELLVWYLRLCEHCHPLRHTIFTAAGINDFYPPHAGYWFSQIYRELIHVTIIEDISDKHIEWQGGSKKNIIGIERKKLAALKNGINPLDGNGFADELSRLFLLCFILCQLSDRFQDNYWKPFLKQYAKWIQEMEKPHWRTMKVRGGKIFLEGYDRGNKPKTHIGEVKKWEELTRTKKGRVLKIHGKFSLNLTTSVETDPINSIKNAKQVLQKTTYATTLSLQGL